MDEFLNLEGLNLEQSTLDEVLGTIKQDTTQEQEIKTPELVDENQNQDQEENKEQQTIEKDKGKAPSSENENFSTFSVFANVLKEEGVLSVDDEEIENIKDVKGLVELVKKQIQESKYSDLSESQKRYLEAVETGIPQNEFEVLEAQLNKLESIDDETLSGNVQVRFDLIAYNFMEKGISKEKAIELANRSIKLGTDSDDAKEALEDLIQIKANQYKEKILAKKEEQKISLEKLKDSINSKDTILNDIKLTPKQKEDLYDLLSVKAGVDEIGQPINKLNKWRNENKLEAEIVLGALYLQTDGFKNLGKILTVSKSKASQELEKRLKQNEAMDLTRQTMSLNGGDFEINV